MQTLAALQTQTLFCVDPFLGPASSREFHFMTDKFHYMTEIGLLVESITYADSSGIK